MTIARRPAETGGGTSLAGELSKLALKNIGGSVIPKYGSSWAQVLSF
jgi:hypothetical protein